MKKLSILLVILFALAGCTALPTEGPVNATRALQTSRTNVDLYATGPVEGASPEQIVEGFINASAAGINDDFAVARQFLSEETALSWVPTSSVRIYSDTRVLELDRTERGAVRLDVDSEATIDRDGRYEASPPDSIITAEFSLARNEDGEWRIVALDDGLLLSSTLFSTQYVEVPLYFLSADSRYLVPDVRYVPRSTAPTATALELVQGPSPWLDPAVRTAIPDGTELGSDGVVVADGTATISLSEDVLSLSASGQALLRAQFNRTFSTLPNVDDVVIEVNGAPIGQGEVPELSSYPYSSSPMLALADGVPILYGNGQQRELNMDTVPPALSSVARGYGEDAPFVGISDGSTLTTLPDDGSAPRSLIFQNGLIPPSVDRYGWIWTGASAANGYFNVANDQGENLRVNAPWMTEGTVLSLHVSREGSRAIIVWGSSTTTRIVAASIVRSSDGEPARLVEPIELSGSFSSILDVAWVSDSQIVVLGKRTSDGNVGLYPVVVGGPTSFIQEVTGARTVTAGSSENSIIVGTESGLVLERSQGAWRRLIEDATSPALPG